MFRQIIALEATQARSVLWMYMDYDSSSVVSCRGLQLTVTQQWKEWLQQIQMESCQPIKRMKEKKMDILHGGQTVDC
jgi:hypothetical protein